MLADLQVHLWSSCLKCTNLDTDSIPTLHLDVECSSDNRAAFSTRPRLKSSGWDWDGTGQKKAGKATGRKPSGPPTCMNIGPAQEGGWGDRARDRMRSLLLVHCDVWLYSHALVRVRPSMLFVDLVIREGKKCLSHRLNKGTIWGPLRGSQNILVSCMYIYFPLCLELIHMSFALPRLFLLYKILSFNVDCYKLPWEIKRLFKRGKKVSMHFWVWRGRIIFFVARGMKTSKALKLVNFHATATTFHPLTMTTAEDPTGPEKMAGRTW